MMKSDIIKRLKKNKYNLYLICIGIVLSIFLISFVKDKVSNLNLRKYDNDILIIKDNDNIQKSYSLKELRKNKEIKEKIRLNNGREEVDVTGVALEKILGNLSYKLDESPEIAVEDSLGNITNLPMSVALEVNRIIIVYKINGKVNKDYDDSLGTFTLIDRNSKNKESWIKDAKVLNIQ